MATPTALPTLATHPRGVYGEILAAPLTSNVTPEEAMDILIKANVANGVKEGRPKSGQAKDGFINVALMYVHAMRLREVLAGNCTDDYERDLYEAVTVNGETISMRPIALEWLRLPTFIPVLTAATPISKVGKGKPILWRVGMMGRGKSEVFAEANPAKAVERGQAFYLRYRAEDDKEFDARIKTILDAAPSASLFYDLAQWQLDQSGRYSIGGEFHLSVIGAHNTLRLDTPQEARPIQMEPIKAVKLLHGIARKHHAPIPSYPSAAIVQEWLADLRVSKPKAVAWGKGKSILPAEITTKDGKSLTLDEKNGFMRVLSGGKVVTETSLDDLTRQWLTDEDSAGRTALAMWATWAAGGAK